jgi:hypothetical protein
MSTPDSMGAGRLYPVILDTEQGPIGIHCLTGDRMIMIDNQAWCQTGWTRINKRNANIKVEGYFILDTIKAHDTAFVYIDSISAAALEARTNTVYSGEIIGGQWKCPTLLNGRLYFIDGSKIWYTQKDAPARIEGVISVNIDDGDEGTALHANGNVLEFFKNRSWYRIQEINFNLHEIAKQENIPGVGCVAPQSVIDIPGGGIAFLSADGIYAMSTALQSPYKEYSGNLNRISDPISTYLDRSISALRECVAWLTPNNRCMIFSFPSIDTSFVYDLANGRGWAVWGFAPSSVTRYDTTNSGQFTPSSNLLFTDGSTQNIWQYGGVKKDNSVGFTATWKSAPLFLTSDGGKVSEFGIWKASDDTVGQTVTFYNDKGDSLCAAVDSTRAYQRIIVNPVSSAYSQMQISVPATVDSLAILGIDLWWQKQFDVKKR